MRAIFALAMTILATSQMAFADVPVTTDSGGLLKNARAKGYAFDIDDMSFSYEPKFVNDATAHITFSLKNLQKNGQLISISDDKKDPKNVEKIMKQFNDLCRDMFDISTAKIPEAKVENNSYSYLFYKVYSMSCVITLPAK